MSISKIFNHNSMDVTEAGGNHLGDMLQCELEGDPMEVDKAGGDPMEVDEGDVLQYKGDLMDTDDIGGVQEMGDMDVGDANEGDLMDVNNFITLAVLMGDMDVGDTNEGDLMDIDDAFITLTTLLPQNLPSNSTSITNSTTSQPLLLLTSLKRHVLQLHKICQHPFLFGNVEDQVNPTGLIDNKLVRSAGKLKLLSHILPMFFATGHRCIAGSKVWHTDELGSKAVHILHFITEKSVEEAMYACAQYKLDISDDKVIQAGCFDNKSTQEEQEEFLCSILEADQEERMKKLVT
ncbi:hypothetical protein BDR05DRAFT_1001805 [Suillus weaverae]|nr:hypothetical protein BDR05DRAFT_1001805 [Suillus weaverae]